MTAIDRMAEGYEPDFDIDYKAGEQGQLWVADVIDAMQSDRGEIKTDEKALLTKNAYFEWACQYRGQFELTGIAHTKAEVWCHVIGDVIVIAPKDVVLAAVRRYYAKGDWYHRNQTRGSHPTKGVIIPLSELLLALTEGASPGSGTQMTTGAMPEVAP